MIKSLLRAFGVGIIGVVLIFTSHCKGRLTNESINAGNENPNDSSSQIIKVDPGNLTYGEILKQIEEDKNWFHKVYTENEGPQILDSAGSYIVDALINKVFPYWYGTPWDFNGHTNVPNEGEVACGYFVSTTLKHIGFNLDRYKMAQQSALNEIKTLGPDYKKYYKGNGNGIVQQMKEDLDTGIYIAGLDCHVGFLFKTHDNLYFIHSNYLFPREVTIEKAETSWAFNSSQSIYVGSIDKNKALLSKWISGDKVAIKMDE